LKGRIVEVIVEPFKFALDPLLIDHPNWTSLIDLDNLACDVIDHMPYLVCSDFVCRVF